ncbi:hypothetical protein PSQ90_02945 [Devosia rhodophyticola]|uniref:AMP nucleosidase n=1 Tax=Devosia rhodophyticola TaxID=3026423 RepID=A0ABY7YYK5_9HYPH|nr:hypothetical protein [Devosia rhodophyticola]WDR06441.1 hypothetical protein PSQ90_02945 [Devosia rhodophyticola]
MATIAHPMLAVFASDKGPGDPERASLMGQAGTYFARRGAKILCLAENGILPVPLITAARAAGGAVTIVADAGMVLPRALTGIPVEVIADRDQRWERVGELADAFIGLPGSLDSATGLFGAWTSAKAAGHSCPVVFLNKHRAFEVLRGYAADVLSPGLRGYERIVQFSETVEDLWSRVNRLINEVH